MNQAMQIGEAILKLSKLYRAKNEHFLKEFKLTRPQLLTIGQIYQEPKTIGQISEAIQLSYSTVSGIIDRLERDGWIQRVRDKSDRRIIWIQKTEKIDEIANTLTYYREQFFQNVLEGLSGDEMDAILHSLQLLNAQLEKKA